MRGTLGKAKQTTVSQDSGPPATAAVSQKSFVCQAWGGHLTRGPQRRTVSRKDFPLGNPTPARVPGLEAQPV